MDFDKRINKMEKRLKNPSLCGKIKAIPSKSVAHRLLICAAFADEKCEIICDETNADISATAECLNALGASVERVGNVYRVTPISKVNRPARLDCGESGSTLRFLLPVASAIGADASFFMHGRLSARPLSPLYEELQRGGMKLSPQGDNPMETSGILKGGDFRLAANVSSQFISGLMFALPLIKDSASTLTLTGKIESKPYIDITLDALKSFGVEFETLPCSEGESAKYLIPASTTFRAPKRLTVEGDWSNAAFWLVAGAIGKAPITVSSLNVASKQGDMEIVELLKRFGADVSVSDDGVMVSPSRLKGISIDASQIPDLVPILAVAASVSDGETIIYGASRLRAKESDRLVSVTNMLSALGADIKETDDGLIIKGKDSLKGGEVDSANDHRIAMAAAVAALVCEGEVIINGAEAVAKSYPAFWQDFENLNKGN